MRAPEFWARSDAASRIAVAALAPLGMLYGASVAWRARHRLRHRANAKVICIGNLTAGGSGKTPVALAVARALAARGRRAMFLSRGYGGKAHGPLLVDPTHHQAADVGDEPLMLAEAAPVVVARDRREGARFADSCAAEIIVMDDGHQNFLLEKDISIVVVDAADPFGNGRMLPAGPLREPVAQGLARADAIVLVGSGEPKLGAFGGPILRARLEPDSTMGLSGQRIVAFAGIGQPRKFFETLRSLGAELVETNRYGDHHVYAASEIARLKAKARANQARLVTTEKDFVRLTEAEREGIDVLRVHAAFEDPNALGRLLDRLGPDALTAQA